VRYAHSFLPPHGAPQLDAPHLILAGTVANRLEGIAISTVHPPSKRPVLDVQTGFQSVFEVPFVDDGVVGARA
jgi:hypothetical protein